MLNLNLCLFRDGKMGVSAYDPVTRAPYLHLDNFYRKIGGICDNLENTKC